MSTYLYETSINHYEYPFFDRRTRTRRAERHWDGIQMNISFTARDFDGKFSRTCSSLSASCDDSWNSSIGASMKCFSESRRRRLVRGTAEYLMCPSGEFFFWKKGTLSVLLLLSRRRLLLLPFFLIENMSNNLQFSELELVSDHTHTGGWAGSARARIRLVSFVWTLDLCAYNWKHRDKTHKLEREVGQAYNDKKKKK